MKELGEVPGLFLCSKTGQKLGILKAKLPAGSHEGITEEDW